MPAKKYTVTLTSEQRQQVEIVARSYKHSELERKRARVLLLADTPAEQRGPSDETIRQEVKLSSITVANLRRRFAEEGTAVLFRKEQAHRKSRCLDGKAEAFLIATVCSAPPQGRARWSLHLLADTLIQAGYCDSISHETVRQTLKKTTSSPG